MKKLLNSLYITSDKTYLSLENENIVISKEGNEIIRVPFINIENIICFNYIGCSPALMGKCASEGIPLNFLRPSGKFLACVTGSIKGNVILRQKQFDIVRNENVCNYLTKNIVTSKIHNSRILLSKFYKNHKQNEFDSFANVIECLSSNIDKVYKCDNLDSIRGIEGESAKNYFSVFGQLLCQKDFIFNGRSKRPPLDKVNAMLSFFYTILTLEVKSAIETVGLDPYVGFMHTDRPGRPALALDLIEELRAFYVDSFVINIINLKQINHDGFVEKENGAIIMSDEARKKMLKLWEDRKKETIKHNIINETIQIGLIPYVQAQLFAKFIRGDIEEYQPFIWS